MLKVVAAEVQLAKATQESPVDEEEEIVFGETTVLEVEVDQLTMCQSSEDSVQLVLHVTIAQIETLERRQ